MSSVPVNSDDRAKAAVTRNGCGSALSLGGQPAKKNAVLLGLLTLLLAAFLLAGCVGATGSGFADDEGDGASGLSASPSSLSFGSVNTGNNSSRTVTVTNPGASSVTVSNVTISGAGFNASGVPTGLTLTPGQTAALAVTFAPASSGAVTGKVTLATGSENPALAVTLSGTGVTPTGRTVLLTWNASTSSVTGYRTYRATTAGGPYTSLNSTPNPQLRWTDSTVQPGTTYYYVVTAVGGGSSESTYSNQATAAIPKS